MNELEQVYSSLRDLAVISESILEQINNISNPRLRTKILEQHNAYQTDLLLAIDFIFEVLECETEVDVEMLLDLNSETTNV